MKYLALCAAVLTLAVPAVSQAATADLTTSIAVSRSGLDLGNARDAAVMLRRLDQAALQACGASHFSLREVQDAVRGSQCFQSGMAQALADLGSPTVTAIYRSRAQVKLASN